ncbi:DBP [Murine adenovirus 3]|uniref:DBP n=1 Tax=Murine adenovirus 3 TaxID=573199 RepID=C3SAU9_9ADEN|nr:DBP [Murine adenovirus 3]ACJ14519.1 DBP [Murine adenovirus 3]
MSCSRPLPPHRVGQQQVFGSRKGGMKRLPPTEAGESSKRSRTVAEAVTSTGGSGSTGGIGDRPLGAVCDSPTNPEPQEEVLPRRRFESSDEEEDVFDDGTVTEEEACWQTAREFLHKMCLPLKVDGKQCTFLPNAQTAELFRKLCHSWLLQQKMVPSLTFTTLRSFTMQMGRFVLALLLQASGLSPTEAAAHSIANVSGVAAWKHASDVTLHCLHGAVMIAKDHHVDLDVSSEGGQRALKEQGPNAVVTTNRWGRSVVRVKYDAFVCPMDAGVPFNQPSNKSCGFCFTDGKKALKGFKQIVAFQAALYPQAAGGGEWMLLCLRCECNFGVAQPILGRQTCRLTPYQLSLAEGLDGGNMDAVAKASVENPVVLVAQCCNVTFSKAGKAGGAAAGKTCEWKISSVDLVTAAQLAKKMIHKMLDLPPSLFVPEFKWDPVFSFRSTVLPQGVGDSDLQLFTTGGM